jgi:hypothetical protein
MCSLIVFLYAPPPKGRDTRAGALFGRGRTVETVDGSQISQTKFEHLRIGNRRSVQATDSQQTMLRRVCSLGFDDR